MIAERSNATADYTLIIPTGFSLIICASIADAFRQLSVNVTTNINARRVTSNYRIHDIASRAVYRREKSRSPRNPFRLSHEGSPG